MLGVSKRPGPGQPQLFQSRRAGKLCVPRTSAHFLTNRPSSPAMDDDLFLRNPKARLASLSNMFGSQRGLPCPCCQKGQAGPVHTIHTRQCSERAGLAQVDDPYWLPNALCRVTYRGCCSGRHLSNKAVSAGALCMAEKRLVAALLGIASSSLLKAALLC